LLAPLTLDSSGVLPFFPFQIKKKLTNKEVGFPASFRLLAQVVVPEYEVDLATTHLAAPEATQWVWI
jgi:hypothetical protein